MKKKKKSRKKKKARSSSSESVSKKRGKKKAKETEAVGDTCEDRFVTSIKQRLRDRVRCSEPEENVRWERPGSVKEDPKSAKAQSSAVRLEVEANIELKNEHIFGEPQKIRAVGLSWVLAAQAIHRMQEYMLQEVGQDSAPTEGWLPTLLKYYREILARKVSGPMGREILTLCTVGDQMLRGHLPSSTRSSSG